MAIFMTQINISLKKRIFNKLTGLLLFIVCLWFITSLISYNPKDPSINQINNLNISNLAGKSGAYFSDLFLQLFGLANIFFILFILSYARQKWKHFQTISLYFRIPALLITIILICCLLATIPTTESWLFLTYGGYVGYFLKQKLSFLSNDLLFFSLFPITMISMFYALSINPTKIFKKAPISDNITPHIEPIINKSQDLLDEDSLEEEHKSKTSKKRIFTKKNLFPSSDGKFKLPSINMLTQATNKKILHSPTTLNNNVALLQQVLQDFGINGKITNVKPGPVVTLYELEPSAGTKSSRIIGLSDDIARSMSALSARIAVIPGKNLIGIELPNAIREMVLLREIFETNSFKDGSCKLPLALGKDIGGDPIIADLTKMPHLLVAGTTGSGKSVAINTMILSLLYKLSPDECKFIMIDPKMLELSIYDGIPHLLAPVVTEPTKAVVALKWVVKEMENRYRLMSMLGVRNIAGYNERVVEAQENGELLERKVQTGFDPETGKPIFEKQQISIEKIPFIVVIVDEMADLMLVAGKDIESSIQRLAQMARAAGIHIIMATQRPSVDVITGVIKANFPSRISFQVTSKIDSRTILGEQGAEQLLGMGDMLFMAGGTRITRVHGPFVDDKEVAEIVNHLKSQAQPSYLEEVTQDDESDETTESSEEGSDDSLYRQAIQIVTRDKKASISYVQRCLRIGYNRAAIIVERMEKEGIVSPPNHAGKREIL
jgi:DNA segregation ATPase FtsK/SpoIIIE, S-DNA-T family